MWAEREEFALKRVGCKSVKAARALLEEVNGDVVALVEAQPWLFETPEQPTGTTSLPSAGAAESMQADMARWRELAGLE